MKESILNDVITIDNEIQHGKPVLRGTRLPIAVIIGSLAGGMTYDEVKAINPEFELTEPEYTAITIE